MFEFTIERKEIMLETSIKETLFERFGFIPENKRTVYDDGTIDYQMSKEEMNAEFQKTPKSKPATNKVLSAQLGAGTSTAVTLGHGRNVRNGYDLQNVMVFTSPFRKIIDFDRFIRRNNRLNDGMYIVHESTLKRSGKYRRMTKDAYSISNKSKQKRRVWPDYIIISVKFGRIERVDIKEVKLEKSVNAHDIAKRLEKTMIAFSTHLCCGAYFSGVSFIAETRKKAFNNFRRSFTKKSMRTGREECELLQNNYDDIYEALTAKQEDVHENMMNCIAGDEWAKEVLSTKEGLVSSVHMNMIQYAKEANYSQDFIVQLMKLSSSIQENIAQH